MGIIFWNLGTIFLKIASPPGYLVAPYLAGAGAFLLVIDGMIMRSQVKGS
jgi:hypothetical protein